MFMSHKLSEQEVTRKPSSKLIKSSRSESGSHSTSSLAPHYQNFDKILFCVKSDGHDPTDTLKLPSLWSKTEWTISGKFGGPMKPV